MTTQYLRNCRLVVANNTGQGFDLGNLRVVFQVRRGDIDTPNTCDARVFNLSDITANQLAARGDSEFTQFALSVSYGDNPTVLIFTGAIRQIRLGREDQKNSYVDITAADGDQAYNFAPAAFTLAAGHTTPQRLDVLIQQMARGALLGAPVAGGRQPITAGYAPKFNFNPAIRGRVFHGDCRDLLRDFAKDYDCGWSIQNGAVNVIPTGSYIPDIPILITPSTGLIGVPEQTQNGLNVRVLLNPQIKIGCTIQLKSTDINQLRYGLDRLSGNVNPNLAVGAAKLNADGRYYVMRAEHSGDTRGNPWYTDLTCLAVDSTVTPLTDISQTTNYNPKFDAVRRY